MHLCLVLTTLFLFLQGKGRWQEGPLSGGDWRGVVTVEKQV